MNFLIGFILMAARAMPIAVVLAMASASHLVLPGNLEGAESAGTNPGPVSTVKRVLIYGDSTDTVTPRLRWFLYDPLILARTKLVVDARPLPATKGVPEADLSRTVVSAYDLVIVAAHHVIRAEDCAGLLDYLDHGGALLLVQPKSNDPEFNAALQQRTGIGFQGWAYSTPPFSVASDHPGARILGLPEGRSLYPHRLNAFHLKLACVGPAVLTRLSDSGEPDFALSPKARLAVLASAPLLDLAAYRRGDPDYDSYQRSVGCLLMNAVRHLLGYGAFSQPVQSPQQRWSAMFQAYGAGREYAAGIQRLEPFHQRLSDQELERRLDEADSQVTLAAQALLRGDYAGCDRLYRQAAAALSESVRSMVKVERYLMRGWHASIGFDDYYGGGVLGYAESEWSDHLVRWMNQQLELIQRTGSRRLIDVYPNEWEILAKYYPQDVARFREAVHQGYLEPIHGLYTAAFLPLLSAETSVRQLEYGLKAFEEVLGARVVSYADPADHYDFHPQLPQLLASFGYRQAVLDAKSGLGTTKPVHADKIRWRGLDGTELEAVPRYEGLPDTTFFTNLKLIATAEQGGYRQVLMGRTVDATAEWAEEQPHSLIDPVAPIAGHWVTVKEFFSNTPPASESCFLGVDDLHADNVEKWSSWGCMNEAAAWNRSTENEILAAERFDAVACGKGLFPPAGQPGRRQALDTAWKNLLRTQDHMTFGAVDYTHQVPPIQIKPGEERYGLHSWGYRFELLPRQIVNIGGMENYAEEGTPNYGGPRVLTTRYEKVQELLHSSHTEAQRGLQEALQRLTVSGERAPQSQPGMRTVCVFNQLGAAKRDLVEIQTALPEHWARQVAVREGTKTIESQVVGQETYADGSIKSVKLSFLADVPALGYKAYQLIPTQGEEKPAAATSLEVSPTRLENRFYIVELDPKHGGIHRVFDKELKTDVLKASEVFGNELWSPSDPSASSAEAAAALDVLEQGPLRAAVRIRSTISGLPWESVISLPRDLKRIDFHLTVDYGNGFNFGQFNKSGTGLFVRFPIAFDGAFFVNQPFGVYESQAAKQVTADFAAVNRKDFGLVLIERNTPSVFWEGPVLRFTLAQGRPLVVGKQIYQYSLYSHAGDVYRGNAFGIAQAVNTPFIVFQPQPGAVVPKTESSYLTINQPNIVLSALYAEPGALRLRLYETAGKATRATVSLPFCKAKRGRQIKLNGETIRPISLAQGALKLDFRPWEIINVSLPVTKP